MTSYGKGARAKATRLASKIIRHNKCCERCGRWENIQHAHAVRRNYSHTRTDLTNGWALCAKCHWAIDTDADAFMEFVKQTMGLAKYRRLKKKAQEGVGVKFDWDAELERLTTIWKELDRD